MKKHLITFVLALVLGVLGFAVSGIAVASPPSAPPGQGDCSHGNSDKPCRDDPQPGHGKDCEPHGNNGGVNEDHCKGEDTTPTETTPTETTDTTDTTETTPTDTTETTPTETTDSIPTETTPSSTSNPPQATVPQETTSEQPASPPESSSSESPKPPSIVGTPPRAQHSPAKAQKSPAKSAVAGLSSKSSPKPTRQPQPAPFTL